MPSLLVARDRGWRGRRRGFAGLHSAVMAQGTHVQQTTVANLEHGDRTLEYGRVTHREGRKVWFDGRIVTFTSLDDTILVERPDR